MNDDVILDCYKTKGWSSFTNIQHLRDLGYSVEENGEVWVKTRSKERGVDFEEMLKVKAVKGNKGIIYVPEYVWKRLGGKNEMIIRISLERVEKCKPWLEFLTRIKHDTDLQTKIIKATVFILGYIFSIMLVPFPYSLVPVTVILALNLYLIFRKKK